MNNEELTDGLIELIWPVLDSGTTKSEILSIIQNVLESWEPTQDKIGGEQ